MFCCTPIHRIRRAREFWREFGERNPAFKGSLMILAITVCSRRDEWMRRRAKFRVVQQAASNLGETHCVVACRACQKNGLTMSYRVDELQLPQSYGIASGDLRNLISSSDLGHLMQSAGRLSTGGTASASLDAAIERSRSAHRSHVGAPQIQSPTLRCASPQPSLA